MPELTLEALAKRVEDLERRLSTPQTPAADWRSVVGMFDDSEFMKQVVVEGQAIREADRAAVGSPE